MARTWVTQEQKSSWKPAVAYGSQAVAYGSNHLICFSRLAVAYGSKAVGYGQ